jgi:hypothetical protein
MGGLMALAFADPIRLHFPAAQVRLNAVAE